jgi:hypothetical protein
MAARFERDVIDYLDDDTLDEDRTPFIPVRPDRSPDGWAVFIVGALTGVAGGALLLVAPWLGGLAIALGYGAAALVLGGSRNGFARSFAFGFAVFALAGAAIALSHMFFPETAWPILSGIAEPRPLFFSTALAPWLAGFAKYLQARSTASVLT